MASPPKETLLRNKSQATQKILDLAKDEEDKLLENTIEEYLPFQNETSQKSEKKPPSLLEQREINTMELCGEKTIQSTTPSICHTYHHPLSKLA